MTSIPSANRALHPCEPLRHDRHLKVSRNIRKKRQWLLTAVALLLPLPLHAAEVTVTLPPLAGLIRMVDPQLEPDCLLGAGGDPHHFQLSPRQAEGLAESRLFIRTSKDDGGWNLRAATAVTLDLWPESDHAWLNPEQVLAALPHLAEAAKRLNPQRADAIDRNMATAQATVRSIAGQWRQALAPYRKEGAIMQHAAWRHLFDAHGVPVHAVLESHKHGHEEGPHALEHVGELLDRYPGALLIGDMRHSNRALEWAARQRRDRAGPIYLDALGSCGTAWETLMRDNIERLQQ